VKTSLAPLSGVSGYLEAADLQKDLDAIALTLSGYGLHHLQSGTLGPLQKEISEAIFGRWT